MKYTVIKPQHNCGICGYIWQTIRAIYHNPNEKYYIDFSNSMYQLNRGTINIWDWFFEQPHTSTHPSADEIEKEVGIYFDQESEFIDIHTIPNTSEEVARRRKMFQNIIDKYIVLKSDLQSKVDDFYESNMKGYKVLGAHFRGTDHPDKKPMEYYLPIISEKLKDYDKIFICSDENSRFEAAKEAFGDKCIYYDELRSSSHSPLHSPRVRREDEYQRRIGQDIIVESYLLSKTDFLYCCYGSNVNFLSRAINSQLPYIML